MLLITFAVLVFQIVQTRILSVIAWYYLAFFAISVAMLGMTAGAVWVYLRRNGSRPAALSTRCLSRAADGRLDAGIAARAVRADHDPHPDAHLVLWRGPC